MTLNKKYLLHNRKFSFILTNVVLNDLIQREIFIRKAVDFVEKIPAFQPFQYIKYARIMRLIAPFTFIYERWLKKIINDVPSQNTFHCLLFKKYFSPFVRGVYITQIYGGYQILEENLIIFYHSITNKALPGVFSLARLRRAALNRMPLRKWIPTCYSS